MKHQLSQDGEFLVRFKLSKVSRFINRQRLSTITYITLSLVLLFALLSTFNTYVLHMKIEMAVVTSPLETISSPLAGQIRDLYVEPGLKIKKGAPLIKIENIELMKELKMAQLNAEDARLNVIYYENLLKIEQQRLKVYENVGSSRLASAEAAAHIAKEEYASAKKNQIRMETLHKKHYLSEADWDLVVAKYRTADDKLKSATAMKELEQHSLNSVVQGLYFTGTKLEGRQQDINVELEVAKNRLKIHEERVRVYQELTNKLTLNAPFDAVVLQVLKTVGNNTDTTKPLLLLERSNTSKSITVYLTQTEVLHLRLNCQVKIYIPAMGRTYHGMVTEINRTSGFIDEVRAQYRQRDIDLDRTAIAIVTIELRDQNQFNREVSAGMPAIVYFPKQILL